MVQLDLNVDRQRLRQAAIIALGTSVANSDGDLDSEWFEALTLTELQAANLQFQVNAARREAKIKAKVFGA